MRAKSFLKTSVNVTETRIDEGAQKKMVTQSVRLEEHCTKLEEHCTKIETTFHLIYAPLYLTNLVFKFNAVLVGFFFFFWCQPQCTYLPFDYHLIYHWSWSLSSASALFIRNNKILMRLGVLFLKVFSFKMLCSDFFMKNAYLVTAKITLDVKNCLYAA